MNPSVRLGYYTTGRWMDYWFFRGLAKGLYDGKTSVVFLDATTYSSEGNSYGDGSWKYGFKQVPLEEWVEFKRDMVHSWQVKDDICFGQWFGGRDEPPVEVEGWKKASNPRNIQRFCVKSALLAGGYWFWGDWRKFHEIAAPKNQKIQHIQKTRRSTSRALKKG